MQLVSQLLQVLLLLLLLVAVLLLRASAGQAGHLITRQRSCWHIKQGAGIKMWNPPNGGGLHAGLFVLSCQGFGIVTSAYNSSMTLTCICMSGSVWTMPPPALAWQNSSA